MMIDVAGTNYRATRPDARTQYRLLRTVAPVLPALSALAVSIDGSTSFAATAAFAEADETAAQAAIEGCLILAEREDDAGAWRPATDGAEALPLGDALRVVAFVVAVNFAPYFDVERPKYKPAYSPGLKFEPVTLPSDMDWFWRPMLRGLCKYESLVDGTLHIEDVATMNAVLDVVDENHRRATMAAEKG